MHDEGDTDLSSLGDDIDLRGWAAGHAAAPKALQLRPQLVTCSWHGFAEDEAADGTYLVGYRWAMSASPETPTHMDLPPVAPEAPPT